MGGRARGDLGPERRVAASLRARARQRASTEKVQIESEVGRLGRRGAPPRPGRAAIGKTFSVRKCGLRVDFDAEMRLRLHEKFPRIARLTKGRGAFPGITSVGGGPEEALREGRPFIVAARLPRVRRGP